MLKKKFRNMSINKKILYSSGLLLLISQTITAGVALAGFAILENHSWKEMLRLSTSCAEIGENAITEQSSEYLKNTAYSSSENSDAVFNQINNQLTAFCEEIETLYKNKTNLSNKILPLPEFTAQGEKNNRQSACSKAFAVDPQNTLQNSTGALAYNAEEYAYFQGNNKNIYKTNLSSWNALSQNEQESLLKNKTVVSENFMPDNLKKELKFLSGAEYFAKPAFISNSAVSSIYLCTASGLFYKYSCDNSSDKYDPRLRKWYTSAVNAKKARQDEPVWQGVYVSRGTGDLCITCSEAFEDSNGNILGVVAIDMYLDNINRYVTNTKIGKSGHCFIADNSLNIVIHPDYIAENTEIFEKSNHESDLNIYHLKNSNEQLKDKISSGENDVLKLCGENKNYYISYSPLKTPGWFFGIITEEDEITAPIEKVSSLIKEYSNGIISSMKLSFLFMLICFFVLFISCCIVIYFFAAKISKSISAPIKTLSEQTKLIGEGNFSLKIPVESTNETGVLASSFNLMSDNLQKYMENLKHITIEKEKIHSELVIAEKIQKSMLPCTFPAFPERKDFDIYAVMDPAREVGGDFYDFFFTDENHLALVIADVSDKGISAALFMVIAKILIKSQFQSGDCPSQVLKAVNKQLCENNEADMFVTCFLGILDINTGEFTYANAGHNPPLIYQKEKNTFLTVNEPHNFVLGGTPESTYTQSKLYLKPEDILFFYTDGVTEAVNSKNKQFSAQTLIDTLNTPEIKSLSLKDMVFHVRQKIDDFSGNIKKADDITMMAFKNFNIPPK